MFNVKEMTIMKKKVYIIPTTEIEQMETTQLLEASITAISGDTGIELGTGDVPVNADSRYVLGILDAFE